MQPVSAGELAVVGGEEDRRPLVQAQLPHGVEDAADLLVDERDVAPVDGDQLPRLLRRHGVEGPQLAVVLLDGRLRREGLAHGGGQFDEAGVVHVVVRVREDVRQVRSEEVGG